MRIQVQRADLLAGVQLVAGAVPTKAVKPALAYLRLQTIYGTILCVHSTDLETHAEARLPLVELEGFAAGEVCVPADKLLAVLQVLTESFLIIEKVESVVVIRTKQQEYNLPTIDPDELPRIPNVERPWHVSLEQYRFRKLLRSVLPCVSREGARYSMQGVCLEQKEPGSLAAVGTDGRRLAVKDVPVEGRAKGSCIVPRSAADLMASVPTHCAQVYWDHNSIDVRWPNGGIEFRIVARLLEGKFPNWQAVMPKSEATTNFASSKESFNRAIRQAAVTVDEETRKLAMTIKSGGVLFESNGTGSAKVQMVAESFGPEVQVCANPAYLVEALKPCGDDVVVTARKPTDPLVLSSNDDGPYTCLVMPLT